MKVFHKHSLKNKSLTYKVFHFIGKFFLALLILLLILIGISQTALFRNFLREELLSIAEKELNGKLKIEKIEGTLFSNLTVYGLNYTQDSIEILSADRIHISFNPFLLLSKTISINDLVLEKAKINLYQFKDSLWIFDKLLKYPPEKDTTPSKPFEYKVDLINFELVDCTLRLKSFVQTDSSLVIRNYPQFNFSDLYLSNINLKLKAFASILSNEIQTEIERFDFATNTDGFELRDLSFRLKMNPDLILVENLNLQTLRTNITLNAKLEKVNIFNRINLENLKNKNLQVDLSANKFSFNDLKQLLPDVNMLDGSVEVGLKASGQFGNLNVEWLSAKLDSTELNAKGNVLNLDKPENLYLQIDFLNSKIDTKDIANLLPLYNLPKFESLGVQRAEIHFEGEPVNFSSNIKLSSSAGELTADAKFNFKKENPTYEVSLSSKDFNIKPFTGLDSKLNLNSRIVGEGFSPKDINSEFDLSIYNSILAGNIIDTSKFRITARDKVFGVNFIAKGDSTRIDLNGKLDFYDKELPKYNLTLNTQHFDLSKRLRISDYPSDLNLATKIIGEGFKLDQIQGKVSAQIYDSKIRHKEVSSLKFESNIDIIENYRSILIRSDFVDVDIVGNFSIENLIDELINQSNYITEEVKSKLATFNPLLIFKDTVIAQTQNEEQLLTLSENEINSFNLNYNLRVKNSDILEIFMPDVQTYVEANINGSISNDTLSFNFSLESNLNDVWFVDKESSKRVKNAVATLNYERSNRSIESKNMFLNIKSKADYVLFGSEFNNISFTAEIDPLNVYYKLNGLIDSTIKIRSEGEIDISHATYYCKIKNATLEYNKYKITNEGPLLFTLNKDKIEFQNFVVRRKDERVKILGDVGLEGEQNLQLQMSSFHLSDLISNVLGDNQNNIEGSIQINASVFGTSLNPNIKLEFTLDSLQVGENPFGKFNGVCSYNDKMIEISSYYEDNKYIPIDLELKGKIPYDLSFKSKKKRFNDNDSIDISFRLRNFNLSPLQAFTSRIKNLSGYASGSGKVKGTFKKQNLSGRFLADSVIFTLTKNDIKYYLFSEINLSGDTIFVSDLELKNIEPLAQQGTIRANSKIELENLSLKKIESTASGSILALTEASNRVSPNLYGDLFVKITEPLHFVFEKEKAKLDGAVLIEKAHLTIPPLESEYSVSQQNFIYSYVGQDTVDVDSAEIGFVEAIKKLNREKSKNATANEDMTNFEVHVKVKLSDNISSQFIFNKELNQRLYAELQGETVVDVVNNELSLQGEIELNPDSYLIFYKKFNASGTLRFERDLSNPYLNVIATFKDYYQGSDTVASNLQEVTIRLKLIGTVTDVAKNLIRNPENIEVEIDGRIDKTKDASDVVAFVILGKFKDDLTAEDKNKATSTLGNTVSSAANSLLGSVVLTFANAILGDVLKSFEVKRIGDVTKFSLSGRLEKIRFKVGGATNLLQDIGTANIQLEYPVTNKFFIRLERKEAMFQVTKQTEMINELGLKYKLEF